MKESDFYKNLLTALKNEMCIKQTSTKGLPSNTSGWPNWMNINPLIQ